MKIFPRRYHPKYLQNLRDLLKVDTARKNALPIHEPRSVRNNAVDYTHCIRLDFFGIAATTIFDSGGVFAEASLYDELVQLLNAAPELNEAGIFIKVRLLLEYPYSISAYTRMQSDVTTDRAAMADPKYSRDLTLVDRIDESMFAGSHYNMVQRAMLDRIQNLQSRLVNNEHWNRPDAPNSLTIRFTPVSPQGCCLFINDELFYDIYLFAKEKREQVFSKPFSPVVQICHSDSNSRSAFDAFEDHFRYLWDLDITLDCSDATFYKPSIPHSLARIKPPSQVRFDHKAAAIKNRRPDISDELIAEWKTTMYRIFQRYCADLTPTPAFEQLFITCSWEREDDGLSQPNHYADTLLKSLGTDFERNEEHPILSARILQAAPAQYLHDELYRAIRDSTIGLVLLTCDMESNGQYYSRPNIYHELGYMMRHLSRDRVIIMAENGVSIPSNVNHIIRINFTPGKIDLCYCDLLKTLRNIIPLDDLILDNAAKTHTARLQHLMEQESISPAEFRKAKERLEQMVKKKV